MTPGWSHFPSDSWTNIINSPLSWLHTLYNRLHSLHSSHKFTIASPLSTISYRTIYSTYQMFSATMPTNASHKQQIIATSSAALQTFSPTLFPPSSSNSMQIGNEKEEHRHPPPTQQQRESSQQCQESYKLYKMCAMSRETEGFNCSQSVASYMKCALNLCK